MGKLDKTKIAVQQNKKFIKWIIVLWLVIAIVLVAPIAVAIADANEEVETINNDPTYNEKSVNIYLGENIEVTADKPTTNWFGVFLDHLFYEIPRIGVSFIFMFGKPAALFVFLKLMIPYTAYVIYASYKGYSKTSIKGKYHDIEHGSSDWSSGGEQYKILNENKGIILAQDNYLPLDKRGNINTLIVGGSGAGKSTGYSIPNAYQMLGSYVFTDPKGELYDQTAGYLKQHGYEIKVLNLVNPQNSDGYNPLMHVASELDVDVIANTVVKGQGAEGKSDPYWDDMAEMLLKALIYYLIATRPEEEQSLASCAEMVRAANTNGGSNLLTELINQLPFDHPARMYYKSIEIASDKTYASILSSLQSKLGKFDSKDIAELTSTDTINFEDIGSKKTAVYVISSDTHTAYDFLLTIFFSQMIQQLYNFADLNGGRLKVPVFFILDEFANIGRVPDFDKKISTSRSRGIQFSVILQNLDQLEAVYEKSYETIVGNCDTHIFLGSNSFKTVEYFSKELGEKTISRESKGVNKDKHYHKQGYNYSEQLMARALMTPDELRRMDVNECIIFVKGLKPIKAKKFYYFEDSKMNTELNKDKINHNDFDVGQRGIWRKYNPYNPYVPDSPNKTVQENLKVESLDDLFEDDLSEDIQNDVLQDTNKTDDIDNNDVNYNNNTNSIEEFGENDVLTDEAMKSKRQAEQLQQVNDFLDFDEVDNVSLPQEPINKEEFTEDIQKELEAKFDELFGPME